MTTKEKNVKLIARAIEMLLTMNMLPCTPDFLRPTFECFYTALSLFYFRKGERFDMETTPISKDAFATAVIAIRKALDITEEDTAALEWLIKETE